MRLGTRTLLWLVPLLLVFAYPLWERPVADFLTMRGKVAVSGPEATARVRSFLMTDLLLTQTRAGHEEIRLAAAEARSVAAETDMDLVGIAATLYDDEYRPIAVKGARARYDSGKRLLTLTEGVEIAASGRGKADFDARSAEAFYEADRQILTLMDQVVVTMGNGFRLTSDVLRYLIPYQRIKTASPVVIAGPRGTIHAGNLTLDMHSGNFRLGDRVTCSLR